MASSEEIIGLVSAALASLCFGSYGVPMKGEAATRVDVDPLVFQTYKAVAVLVSVVPKITRCRCRCLAHSYHMPVLLEFLSLPFGEYRSRPQF